MACTGDLFVQRINRTECIGNSLVTINNNFSSLDSAICDANNIAADRQTIIENSLLSQVMNGRLSLSPSEAVMTEDVLDANFIYYHPYNGNRVALWNIISSKWEIKQLPGVISKQLIGCDANKNYDIYLHHDGTDFQIETVEWTDSDAGAAPPTLATRDGALLRPLQPNKRLIGCLRTTGDCVTEFSFGKSPVQGGSHPKFLLWNSYNRVTAPFSILDSGINGSWSSTGSGATASTDGPFQHFGGGSNNRLSFITRENCKLNVNSCYYVQSTPYFYFIHSLDKETPTVVEYFTYTPSVPIFQTYGNQGMSHSLHTTVASGFHFVQLAVMTEPEQRASFIVWKNDRHSGGTVGYVDGF